MLKTFLSAVCVLVFAAAASQSPAQDFPTREIRQSEVKNYNCGLMLRGENQPFLSRGRGQDTIIIRFQRDREQAANLRFVVND